jgi:hypothetical protein
MSDNLSRVGELMERRMGAAWNQSRVKDYEKFISTCPPIDPHLLKHLRKAFAYPMVKHNDPEMSQKLILQHGCEKVIKYLESQYAKQSEALRKGFEA